MVDIDVRMLKDMTPEEIRALRITYGVPLTRVELKSIPFNTIIRIETASGNCYLANVVNGAKSRAHLYRFDARIGGANGFMDSAVPHTIAEILAVGRPLRYWMQGAARRKETSRITKLTIVGPLESEVLMLNASDIV